MKKILTNLTIALLTFVGFTSCDIDNSNDFYVLPPYAAWYWQPFQQNNNGQWLIGGPVNNYGAGQTRGTRAYTIQTSDVIANYSNFSLFGFTPDSVVMNNFEGTIEHQTYTWGYATDKKYFDNNVAKYSFLGIIPFNSTLSMKSDNSVDVSLTDFVTEGVNPNDQKYNKEFIVANTEVEKANYSQGANLDFYHQNAIVRLKFETSAPNALEIIDFTPHVDYQPATPATPGTETTTSKSTKFIDELVAGNTVQVGIGFVGSSSPKLTKNNPTTLYVGTNNASLNYMAKDWLLSIKDAVNNQFEYYKLDNINGTTYSATSEDWLSSASNKNIYMMKLANGVNATNFANGNDAFMSALTAHENDWYGGSPAESFKAMFEQAYAEGWRVIRINESDANTSQVLVFLSNNQQITTKVTEVTGGSPGTPEIPESGVANIVILPATSALQTGKDAVISTFPSEVTANVSLNGISYTTNTTVAEMKFTKPGMVAYSAYSPTNWYTFPVTHDATFGFTIKFSYRLNGVTKYDARVFVPATKCNWQAGKWYDYVITVNSDKHGKVDPNEADPTDPKIEEDYPIKVNTSTSNIDEYTNGETWTFTL